MDSVQICNLALSHISQGATVTSIDPPDGTANAQHCAQFFAPARDMLLEMHEWRFATFRLALTAVTNPVDHWAYAYQVPAEMIRPVAVLLPESTSDEDNYPYVIEMHTDGTQILYTNVQDAVLKYVKRVTDMGKWTPLGCLALSWLIAHFIAGPITKKPAVVESTLKMFTQVFFPMASHADASGQKSDVMKDFTPDHLKVRGISLPLPDARVVRS